MNLIRFKPVAFSIFILAVLILLIGCTVTVRENQNQSTNQTSLPERDAANDGEDAGTLTPSPELNQSNFTCTPRWRCISSKLKAYQLANCSFVSKLECPLGCFNDSCRVGATCTPGFGCVNDHIKGYKMENCQWTSQTNCDWKCENAECVPKPENYTGNESAAASTAVSTPAPEPRRYISVGGVDNITVGGVEHAVSIYALEPDRVRMNVDEWRSDWVLEGGTVIFSNGVTLVIKEILFQSFSGGQRKVGYTVG